MFTETDNIDHGSRLWLVVSIRSEMNGVAATGENVLTWALNNKCGRGRVRVLGCLRPPHSPLIQSI